MKLIKFFSVAVILSAFLTGSVLAYNPEELEDINKIYTLPNGTQFRGDYAEYSVATYLSNMNDRFPIFLAKVWDMSAKKNVKKFVTSKQILSTAKFEGNAGYDSSTKEFYLTRDSKSGGKIIFEVNNKNLGSNIDKLHALFAKNADKEFEKESKKQLRIIEKDFYKVFGVKVDLEEIVGSDDSGTDDEWIRPGSDLEKLMDNFEALAFEIDEDITENISSLKIDVAGYTNTNNMEMISFYTSPKKPSIFNSNQKLSMNTYKYFSKDSLPKTLSLQINHDPNDIEGILTKPFYIYVEIDEKAAVGTTFRFRINDIRQFASLKSSDIWIKQ